MIPWMPPTRQNSPGFQPRYVRSSQISDEFARIGEAFGATGREKIGPVAAGTARLSKVRQLVDFGVHWMEAHR